MTEIQFPRISVVTPSFNQGKYIRETIESVLSQNYPNLEYIVIDGGSTDSTLAVIDDYVDRLNYFVSEKDNGQSHAINKGFAQATGDIFCWLNSDDQFAPNALWSMAIAFHTNRTDMVAGICEIYEDGNLIHRHMTSCGDGKLPLHDILDLDNGWNAGQFFYQPEVFFTRELWERAGGYVHEDYFYSMDYELWCRFAFAGASLSVIGTPIVKFRAHSEQKTTDQSKFKSELIKVRDRFCSEHGIHWSGTERPAANWGKRLRIALINDLGYRYGAGIAQMRIAAAFELAGHELAVFDLESSRLGAEYSEIIDSVRQFSPDLVMWGNLHGVEKTLPNLISDLESKYPCFWLTHDFWILSGRCPYTAGCPRLLTGCNSDCPTTNEYPVIKKYKINSAWIEKRDFLSQTSRFTFLANSTWAEDFVNKALQTFSNTIPLHKIRLGVPADVFTPRDKLDCKQKMGIKRDRFTLLFSSASLSDKRKGGPILSDALRMIELDNIALIVIGRLDQDLNLSGVQLVKLGYVDDVEDMVIALNAADLFVGPSVEETFGQVFIEAAMCGTPSLGFDVTGVKDAIKEGITGCRLKEISSECLAAGIVEMHDNREALSRMSQLAPLYARNVFSLEASYGSFFSVLERMGVVDKAGIPHKISFAERSAIIELASRGRVELSLREDIGMAVNTERDQLAEDILYLEYLIDVEKNDIKRKLTQRVTEVDSDGERIDAICDEISSALTQLSARAAVLEKILVSRGEKDVPEKSGNIRPSSAEEPLKAEVSISVPEIVERNSLSQFKYTDSGRPYFQIMPDSRIQVDLAVDRSEKRTLAVNICGEIDHAFLNEVEILVDGERIKHKVAHVKDYDRLICHLPVMPGRRKTEVEILTPNVSTGSLCLSDICCVSRQTLSGYIKQLTN